MRKGIPIHGYRRCNLILSALGPSRDPIVRCKIYLHSFFDTALRPSATASSGLGGSGVEQRAHSGVTTQIAAEFRVDGDVVKYELHHALRALRTTLQSAGDGQLG